MHWPFSPWASSWVFLIWPAGPSYKGKSVKRWFYGTSRDTAEAFRAMGQDAVPFLVERLGMIGRQPDKCVPAILPFMTSPNVGDRQKALWALLSFGTNAPSAKPAIQAAVNDSDPFVRSQAEAGLKTLE